jgi:chromosome segregation ATPase
MYNRDGKLTVSVNEQLKKEAKANLGPDETLSDHVEQAVLMPLANGKTKEEMIKQEIEREEENLRQKEQVRDEKNKEIKASAERIQHLKDELARIQEEKTTYADRIAEVVGEYGPGTIARDHKVIGEVAAEYGKAENQVRDDLRDAGLETHEVEL